MIEIITLVLVESACYILIVIGILCFLVAIQEFKSFLAMLDRLPFASYKDYMTACIIAHWYNFIVCSLIGTVLTVPSVIVLIFLSMK